MLWSGCAYVSAFAVHIYNKATFLIVDFNKRSKGHNTLTWVNSHCVITVRVAKYITLAENHSRNTDIKFHSTWFSGIGNDLLLLFFLISSMYKKLSFIMATKSLEWAQSGSFNKIASGPDFMHYFCFSNGHGHRAGWGVCARVFDSIIYAKFQKIYSAVHEVLFFF